MSRYIISPSHYKDVYMLLPSEGISEQIKTIELPKGIFPDFNCNELLIKLSKADVQRSKDGLILIKNKQFNIKYDDFVNNCCSGDFKTYYEPIFCHLRDCGITF